LADLELADATFACPDLTGSCRLDELGLAVTGQRVRPDRAVLAYRVVEPAQWCRRCGCSPDLSIAAIREDRILDDARRLRRVPQRPPEHVRTPGMRSLLPGLLHQPGPRDLKG
jgi:hypothetical protein